MTSHNKNLFLIGLTGNIACGKSTVIAMLRELGAEVIDADGVTHVLQQPGQPVYQQIVAAFGQGIVQPDGSLNRRALAAIVFNSPGELQRLEQIVHPAVRSHINAWLDDCAARAASQHPDHKQLVVIDAIKLLESGWKAHCDQIWVVTCTKEQQLQRLMATRAMSREEALQRIEAQSPQHEKIAQADVVIDNSGSLEATRAQVSEAVRVAPGGPMLTYIGTYTQQLPHVNGQAQGIYACRLDTQTGKLSIQSVATGVTNPSFVTISPDGRYLYAAQELDDGLVTAFAIDQGSGDLTLLNSQPSGGAHPCYVHVTADGRWLLVANYTGATVSALPIQADGSIAEATITLTHTDITRHHDAPHPHAIIPTLDAHYALVADCGLDRVYVYRLGQEQPLSPQQPAWLELTPGAGPRHMALHSNRRSIYCINERSSSLTTLAFNAQQGTLQALQTLSTLPEDFTGANTCADIHIHPSGRWLYGSNRGHDSLAIFAIDTDTCLLDARGHISTGGRTPRNFAIHPSGEWLLAANQDSSTIVSFRIDPETGMLKQEHVNELPTPVCVQFALL